ncbi:unnamed protein product [Orchesella dallaii]|uniref:Uncharacterized protein n=1 Tax=Orchesella dallaii TaxID=48710 RepID=A0ABP1PUU4_9HEXA
MIYHRKGRKAEQSLITNVNQFLKPFSHCMIHIVNYDGQDFVPLLHPVFLTRHDFVSMTYNTLARGIKITRQLLPYEKIAPNNFSLTANFIKQFSEQKQTNGYHFHSITKPWRCESHFYIHPPNLFYNPYRSWYYEMENLLDILHLAIDRYTVKFRFATASFRDTNKENESENGLLQTTMRYDVLVSQNLGQIKDYWIEGIRKALFSLKKITTTTSWELFGMETIETRSKVKGNFQVTKVYHFCHNCNKCIPFHPILLHDFNSRIETSITSEKLETQVIAANLDMSQIILKLAKFSRVPTSGVVDEKTRLLDYTVDWDIEQKVVVAALGNISFQTVSPISYCLKSFLAGNYGICGCGPYEAYYPKLYFLIENPYSVVHFPFHEYRLKFVSCGYLHGNVHISDVLSVYDAYTWLSISMTVIILPVIFYYLETEYKTEVISFTQRIFKVGDFNYFTHFIGVIKTLLEQGIDTRLLVLRETSSKLTPVIVCLGLAAFVLSNAFKGDNIKRISSPLHPTPFSTLKQLVEQEYEIFSNLVLDIPGGGTYHSSDLERETLLSSHAANAHLVNYPFTKINIISEIMYYISAAKASTNAEIRASNGFTDDEYFILNNTKLSPIYTENKFTSFFYGSNNFWKFRNCSDKKIAAIYQETDLSMLRRAYLRSFGRIFVSDLSFGEEILGSVTKGFVFTGWVNPNLARRFENLQRSGFVEYLRKLRRGVYTTYSSTHFPTTFKFVSTSMSGSIKVIFIIFPVGFGIALFALIFEESGALFMFLLIRLKRIVFTTISRLHQCLQ